MQPMSNRAIAIEAAGLSKILGDRPVLAEIDLTVVEGQAIAITGANGAGKTTLLRCLAALCRPTRGEVRWFGKPAGARAADRRLIGMAAHESYLYPSLTVRENLIFAARMYDVSQPGRLADELIRGAGLGPHADALSSRLSQGMRRRVAVLRALAHDPPILLLDEPFAGLDARGATWLCGLLAGLRERGRTVCFTTHDPHAAADLTDRVVQLRSGRLEGGGWREAGGGRRGGDGGVGASAVIPDPHFPVSSPQPLIPNPQSLIPNP